MSVFMMAWGLVSGFCRDGAEWLPQLSTTRVWKLAKKVSQNISASFPREPVGTVIANHFPPAMKTKSIPHLIRSLAVAAVLAAAPQASAQVDATSWTSVEGTTIWARLDGLEGGRVILNLRGKTYRVPMNRLAPKSIEKARRMLNLPAGTTAPPAVVSRPKTKPAATPPPAPEPPLPIAELELAATPESSIDELPVPSGMVPLATGTEVDLTGNLPELAAAVDPADDTYGLLLPPRDTVIPPAPVPPGSRVRLVDRLAVAPAGVPSLVLTAVAAGNRLQTKSYKWGGGRASLEDSGYDCSGSVSYVLIKAGLLRSPLTSGAFTRYGAPGPGRWITIYARNGHVFMSICGLRLDTGGRGGRGESGPRWSTSMRGTSGFVMRHPPGL
jgi:cell wall-associated NlpC family hydrolase